jgi:AraC-like DNA-binding protein
MNQFFFWGFLSFTATGFFFFYVLPPPPPPPHTHTHKDSSQILYLFEQIFDELTLPRPGGVHIVIGYVERLLSLIPRNYKVSVEWNENNRKRTENHLFAKIRFLLEDCYEDVSMQDLISAFGHNTDYFNRLIKRHTGMTYSAFLQNIRLERAEFLLKATEFPVAEIACKTGYESLGYFYKIFTKKFGIKPNEMREAHNDK